MNDEKNVDISTEKVENPISTESLASAVGSENTLSEPVIDKAVEEPVKEKEDNSINIEPQSEVTEPKPVIENKDNNETKKKKNILPIIIVILVILLIGGGVFAYFKILNNPTAVFKSVINSKYDEFKDSIKNYDEMFNNISVNKKSVKVSGDLTANGTLLSLDTIKDDKINYSFGLDYANKKLDGSIELLESDSKIADGNIYMINDKIYVSSSTLLKNIVELDSDTSFSDLFDFSDMEDIEFPSGDDIEYITAAVKNAIVDALNSNDMTSSSEEITINSLKVKTTKYSYNLSKDSVKNLMTKISNSLINNDTFMNKLSELTDVDKDSLKTSLESMKDETAYEDITKTGTFSIYTTGLKNEAVKYEFIYDTIYASYSDYKDNAVLSIKNGEELNIEANSVKKDNAYNIDVNYNSMKIVTLTVREFDNKVIDFDFDSDISALGLKANGTIKMTCDKKDADNMSGIVSINLNADISGTEQTLSLNSNYNVKYGDTIADVDVSKAISELTDADTQQMQAGLVRLQNSKIYTYLSSFSGLGY